jgi:hypothetical protein
MALTKPAVTSVWASTASDNVTPTDAYIAAGWPLSTTPPSRGRFNWLLNYLYNGVRYFSRRGIPDYDAAETYMSNDRIMGPDGITYLSLVDNNIANTPASSPTKWLRWGFSMADFSSSLAINGYQKLPGGLIVQWVRNVTATANGSGLATVTATYPIAFPNAVLSSSFYPVQEAASTAGMSLCGQAPTTTSALINIAGATPSTLVAVSGIIIGK